VGEILNDVILDIRVNSRIVREPMSFSVNADDIVTLGPRAMAAADKAALLRQRSAEKHFRPDAHGFKGDGLAIHRLGCFTEIAFALWVALPWTAYLETLPRGNKPPDVGDDFQVRGSVRSDAPLRSHKSDSDSERFVRATWNPDDPEFVHFHGWVYGREAKVNWVERPKDRSCYERSVFWLARMETIPELKIPLYPYTPAEFFGEWKR